MLSPSFIALTCAVLLSLVYLLISKFLTEAFPDVVPADNAKPPSVLNDHFCSCALISIPYKIVSFAKIPGATKLEVPIRKACKDQKGYANKKHHKWFLLGHYKGIIRDNMKQYLPKHIKDKVRKVGFAHPWDSRDAEKNDVIGLQDWDIVKEQSQKYFSFNVDFKHELKDNV